MGCGVCRVMPMTITSSKIRHQDPLPRPDLDRLPGVGWLIRERLRLAAMAAFPGDEQVPTGVSKCHCGTCSRYARCKFRQPRGVFDVLHNIDRTGSKAGSRVCAAAMTIEHFADDVLLSLGMGAGSCVAGFEIGRGTHVRHLFGVEVEPLAVRVAQAAFPTAEIRPAIEELEIPRSGRLVVLSSLVFNCITPDHARRWASFLAGSRASFLHISIGRAEEPGQFGIFEVELARHGMRQERHSLPENIDFSDAGYATRATWWTR